MKGEITALKSTHSFLFAGIILHLHNSFSMITTLIDSLLPTHRTHPNRYETLTDFSERVWTGFRNRQKLKTEGLIEKAVLVKPSGQKLAFIQPKRRAVIGKSLLIVKLNQELTNRIMRPRQLQLNRDRDTVQTNVMSELVYFFLLIFILRRQVKY